MTFFLLVWQLIHTHFRLLMNSSESQFFEVWHWWVCSSSLDLRVINKSCTLSVTCCQQILYTFSHMFSFTLVWTPFLKFVCNVCFWVRSDGFGLSLQVLVQKYLYYCIMFIDPPPHVDLNEGHGKKELSALSSKILKILVKHTLCSEQLYGCLFLPLYIWSQTR